MPALTKLINLASAIVIGLASITSLAKVYKEEIQEGEAEVFAEIGKRFQKIQKDIAGEGEVQRVLHAKTHACYNAEFEVLPSNDPRTRASIFALPKKYPALVRFSNAKGVIQADIESDMRGLAIKVLDVQGSKLPEAGQNHKTQDFLMTNGAKHFVKNATEMVDFIEEASQGGASAGIAVIGKLARGRSALLDATRDVPSLLSEQYWSRLPFRLGYGENAPYVKYSTVACNLNGGETLWDRKDREKAMGKDMPEDPKHPSQANYLTDDLLAHVEEQGACFEFLLQFQRPKKDPIEDPTKEWKGEFIPVARLYIAKGSQYSFHSQQGRECEESQFNPWNGLSSFRPVGNMNRARAFAYEASQGHRLTGEYEPILSKLSDWARIENGEIDYEDHKGFNLIEGFSLSGSNNRRVALAALVLGKERDHLMNHNLFDTTDEAEFAQIRATSHCLGDNLNYRTANGLCNNLENPGMGAFNSRFGRNVPLDFAKPKGLTSIEERKNDDWISPNPRQVSLNLLSRGSSMREAIENFKPAPIVNLAAAAWLQFMVHDWFFHGDNENGSNLNEIDSVMNIPLASSDPLNRWWLGNTLKIPRTKVDNSYGKYDLDKKQGRTFRNQVTHWWDGSQLYGSSQEQQNIVRGIGQPGHQPGKVLVKGAKKLLPTGSDGIAITGFNQNWWLGLELMHHLFVLEHNAIVDMLMKEYPLWKSQLSAKDYDNKLFNTARLINSALIAKIHTVEWTPAILPNTVISLGMVSNWYGYARARGLLGLDQQANPFDSGINSKDQIVGGLVGNESFFYDVPFTLTEEFVSVYRMHSLLPDLVKLSSLTHGLPLEYTDVEGKKFPGVLLADTVRDKSHSLMQNHRLEDLWYSFGSTYPGALTLGNFPFTLQNLVTPYRNFPFIKGIDIGTVDIVRDRERGSPRFNDFRRAINLEPFDSWNDFGLPVEQKNKLKEIYGDIEKVDLLVGCLAESKRPLSFGFGETAFHIFLLMASRRLMTDRFFNENYTAEYYTDKGLKWVQSATMASVLRRHFSQLGPVLDKEHLTKEVNSKFGFGGVHLPDNAFLPWKKVGKPALRD